MRVMVKEKLQMSLVLSGNFDVMSVSRLCIISGLKKKKFSRANRK